MRDIYEIADKVGAEVEKRFSNKNIVMMRGITALSPGSTTFIEEKCLGAFSDLFNGKYINFLSEAETFKHLLVRKQEQHQPKSLLQIKTYLEKLKEPF